MALQFRSSKNKEESVHTLRPRYAKVATKILMARFIEDLTSAQSIGYCPHLRIAKRMKKLLITFAVIQMLVACDDVRSRDEVTKTQGGMTSGEMMKDERVSEGGMVVMAGSEVGGESGPQQVSYVGLIHEVTTELVGEQGAVGAVVIIVTEEHTEVLGLGLRDLGGEAVDAQTLFQIGSVSKTVTGLLLASKIEKSGSTLSANDPVNLHLTNLVVPDGQGGPITMEHLATHYSALPNFPDNLIGPPTSPGQGYTRELLNIFLSAHTLDYEPGTRYLYSNLGYGLLGLSLADAEGASGYEQLLNDHFIEPLSLERTGLNRPEFLERIGDNVSQGFGGDEGRTAVGFAEMGALAGSGEILSTGSDMAVFLRVMCGLSPFPVPGAIDRALTPRAQGEGMVKIAYGWDVKDSDPPMWTKSGLTPGFTSYVALQQNPPVGVAILSNRGRHRAIMDAVNALITRVTLE